MERALPTTDLPPPEEARGSVEIRRPVGRRGDIDAPTLAGAMSGDRAAIERFVRHYQGPVFAFLSRSAGRGPHVEDLAQEVFLRVLRALPQFVKSEAKVSTWIFQIAVRLLQDQRKRPQRVLVPVTDDLRDGQNDPEESCARRRMIHRIELLGERLPEEQRMALVLTEFHGFSHDEVAEVLGCRVATIKTRLHRARAFLREGMKQERGELL